MSKYFSYEYLLSNENMPRHVWKLEGDEFLRTKEAFIHEGILAGLRSIGVPEIPELVSFAKELMDIDWYYHYSDDFSVRSKNHNKVCMAKDEYYSIEKKYPGMAKKIWDEISK